jgi:hypothetical protein
VAAVKADGVRAIVFDVADIDAQGAASSSSPSSFQYILNEIAALGATSFSNIGIVQHNTGAPFHRFFAESQGEVSTIAGVETADPTLQTWAGFAAFVTTLKTTYGVQNVDLMACALYSDPNWKYVIDTLATQTGVTIRASTDDTGAAALGGDWFLESHTGVNLKDVYFTEAIENFSGVLVYSTKYDSLFTTKSFAVGKATAWGAVGNGGNINTITGGVVTSGVVALYSSSGAFAALKTNGSVSTWGDSASGGNQTVGGTSVASNLNSGVVEICSTRFSMAALKSDGTVVTWGHTSYGGVSSSVDLTNVVDIYSGSYAFAALKSNGSVVTWGDAGFGGNSSTASPNLNSDVVSVNMSHGAGAALKSNGSVVTWPTGGTTGGNSSAVASSISSNVVVVYTDYFDTFAALKNDGRVITWGTVANSPTPIYASSVTLTNIVTLNGRNKAYAALNINGGVVTWGVVTNGGDSSGKSLSSNVVKVYNVYTAFAALKFDGSVVTWGGSTNGGDSSSVASELTSGVVAIYGTESAFAALKSNGKVITWGSSSMGANSSSVATDISAGIVAIYATPWAFSALRNDGKLITWGDTTNGGNSSSVSTDLSAGVVSVNNTGSAFAAITSTATTFDLSMSYYRDIDRYNILRNKENRRRVNLTTLNNNVFTLSSARDVQKFNYTIPSGNSFRIIIPDYVSSNYSIISTATLPSDVSANYIIACEEGEPVTISGVTYINYGAFVYRRNLADNTFTKMTSTVIGGVTYNLYGGDGIFSSGIAFQYRFGAFAVPEKTFGDASFNITAPLTDSSGAFTYTSSNTAVATVTAGGTVTIIRAGTTTITATQAASGRFSSDSITASLVVNKVVSTLGALTVPAKLAGDAPFTLTAPTSTTLSFISPVNTITSTASMIVPPPMDILDIRDISYGTTWLQWGADIVGNQADERSGTSVSMSADGTVVAIGSYTYNVTGSNEGRTRVYKYNGTSWGQLGLDISGTQADEISGVSVSLSADGTIVAIGSSGFNTTIADVGRTRVYKYNGTSWVQLGLDISGNQTSEESGYSVCLSADGTTVAIGSYNYDKAGGTTNAGTNEGRTRIYKYDGSAWGQLGLDISANQVDERSGYSVSLSTDGTIVAIGSYTFNVTGSNEGRTRVYKYNGTSWGQLGLDISGTQADEISGISVSLSADGTIVAIGSSGFNTTIADVGRTRVFKYNGTSWIQLGLDISGNQTSEESGYSVSLSADGTIVAVGSYVYDKAGGTTNAGTNEGRTRVYKYNGSVWSQIGLDISANQVDERSGYSVSLSSDGTTVAVGSPFYDSAGGNTNSNTSQGRTRIYNIATTNAITYTSSSSSIADVCGNLLLIKGVNGTSAITASQSGNTYTGRLDVSGTTYTLQYNAITFTSSNTNVATVSTYGTVTITRGGTSTITATQPETLNYVGRSVSATLDVSKLDSTLGALTVPAKLAGDTPFTLTTPTSTVSSIISPVNTITSTASVIPTPQEVLNISYGTVWGQMGLDISGNQVNEQSGWSVSISADGTVVAIGSPYYDRAGGTTNSSTSEGRTRIYKYNGTSWGQLGLDISGTQASEQSGYSVSLSADGMTVAIGSSAFDTTIADVGRTRVYKYNGTSWVQLGLDISGNQAAEQSGWSVSLSADGTVVAIGSFGFNATGNDVGRTRVYKYNGTSWVQLGLDISGNQTGEQSGWSVSLSADGMTLAIGSPYYDKAGGTTNTVTSEGRTRVYKYDGTSWGQLGLDISGNQADERSGYSVSLSADGTTVAIGSYTFNVTGSNEGRTRIYKYNGTSWGQLGLDISGSQADETSGISVCLSADGTIVAIGSNGFNTTITDVGRTRIFQFNGTSWIQLGLDISGNQTSEFNGTSVSLSADGTKVAIGSDFYDRAGGTTNAATNEGRTRVYSIDTTNALTYSSSNSSIADVCGNLLIIKGVNGTSTITASQTGNTVTGRLDVSGTTYTLQYNPITYTIDSTSVASVSTYGTVTLTGAEGTSTITATQPETLNYASKSVSATLDVSRLDSTLGALAIPSKLPSDAPFTLTAPTSTVSSIISPVNTITSTTSVIPTPPDIRNISYGTTWSQLGLDISGTQLNERSGYSVSISADGNTVAIGSVMFNVTGPNQGRTRIYKYNGTSWRQLGSDILGIQEHENSGYSVSLSADGTTVAIGSYGFNIPTDDEGRTRIYRYNGTSWVQLGLDISGNQVNENSGYSVSLSADGNTVAIGSYFYDKAGGSTDTNTQEGRTRIYRYNEISWIQLGLDISGTQVEERSGTSVSLSADGTTVAIGSSGFNIPTGNEGRTRIYRYNGISWVQQGLDISGTQVSEDSGCSVSLSADGNTVAIGSYAFNTTNNNEGRTRVFQFNGTSWIQLGLDILGDQVSENSGISVSLSADGTIVAIGSNTYDRAGGTTNTNTQEGRTRIYRYNGTSWGQLGLDILGDQAGEDSGRSLSLSADGTTVAIGSYYYNTTITDVGRTRVYKIPTTNALTYSSSNSSIADVCGNLLLIKGVNGTSTITASQTGNTITGRLDVSGTTYTLQYNPITYTISDASLATVSTYGTVTLTGAQGTSTITATQPETLNYASKSVTATLSVSLITPTIGTLTAPAKNFGDASFNLTAPTSNSDGAFSYTSSVPGVATVTSGGTVTIVGAGTTTITATQDASGNYTTGSVTASLVVSPIAPSIGALSAPAKNFGDAAFSLTAPTSDSSGAFTYDSSNTAVATVTSGGTVTIVGAGTTTITATQDASGNYTTGSVTASLVVSPIAPSIGALTAPAKNFGDAAFDLTAPTSDSSGAFSYTSSVPGVATVTSGGTVTVVGAGTTTITATQDASGNYTTGSVTASLVVSPIAPTIGALSAPAKNFGDASFNLTAPTSNSDGAFSYTSSAPGVATVTSGGTVTVVGAGTTTITATQDASGNYTGGSSVTASLVVSPITPTYQSISQITKTYGTDVSFSLTAVMSGVSNSSGAYTFSSTSAAIDICGGVATILAYTPSAITITATQAASGNYNGSGSTTFAVLVNRKTPSYGAFSVPAATYEDAPFSIAAYAPTTDSTSVPFTYTSSEPTVATISSDGTVVTIIGQGYTTITASQDASGNYAAGSVTTSFLVNRAAPTFLKAFTIPDKTFGDAPFSLLPFTEGLDNTDGRYQFSVTSSNAQLVSISEVDGVTATIHAYTPTPITIYVAIDACGNYAASSTSGTLTVARAAPSIGALSAPAKNFGDASFNLTAPTSDSSGAFTYTSSAPGVATVTSTGGTVTIVGAGTTTITATQDASGNYTGGSVTASLVVSPIAPSIGALSVPAKNFGDASFNLTAPTSDSSGAFTYTSSAPGVATVTSGGTVTIVGAGSTTITATQAASADGNYTGGSSVTASLVVSASLSNFTVPSGKVYGDASFNLTDPTTIDNTVGFTFTSSDSTVATISGRTVTIVGAGSSVITASQAATANRSQMDISATLVVAPAVPVITLAAITKTYGSASFRLNPTSTNTDDASGTGFSFTSSNTGVASIVDTSFVSINGVGEATITISQAATANFTDGSGSVVVTVNKGTPTLSTLSVSANKTYGSAPFSILTAPTSASAGAITYSSSDTGVATIDNSGVITLIAAGYVNFTATQAATALYNSATKTSNTMKVHRQSIFLTRDSPSLEIVNKIYGDEYFIVSATNAASGGALTYESDTPSVAGVINASTGVISVVSVGTATITATRAQTAQYTSVPVSWTIQVARATTTLTGLTDLSRNVTVAPFAVTASSASDGAVSYALQDPSSSILTIHPTSGLVRLLSPGSAVIVASQAQGTLYEAPSSITATITVTPIGNALEGATLTDAANYSDVNLNDAIINNANISGSNFAGAKLTGATFTGASIIGATFTNATLVRANLSGVSISRTDFTNADLSGATLTGVDASGTIFNNASLANVNLSGANVTNVNFTNTIIKGANITDVSFTPLQKLQLLKKSDNRDIAAIAISSVSGPTILAAISASSPARTIANLDLSNVATTVAVYIPETSTTPDGPITDISLDVVNNTIFYLPINENEYFRIGNIVYYSSSGVIRKYTTNEIIEVITYDDKPVWLIVGSIIGLVLQTNTMNASSFVVPSTKLSTDTEPFMPTTLPTSNSDSPIVYSSSSPHLATINETTGEITITGNGNGLVTFTATQVQNATYGPATITSNTLLIDQYLHFSLVGLNQSFNLTTLASLDTLNLIADTTDATAVFYVRLSDMTDIFKYQSDAVDVNDISATDLKYYVFNRKWPAELKINPSHAMLNKTESAGMLGTKEIFIDNKMFVKHDFVRYLALKLFNTIHGVDLFANETDLQENATYYGESIRHNINEIMSGISTTSGDESMACDASGNKYLTNSASGNTNLCRELMRQIAAAVASRFYNNGADNAGMKTVPLREDDTITFKVTIQAAATQNMLTGVTEIPSRSYTIKLVLKSSVTSVTNANTVISDSEMYPNAYPYSSSVTSIAPDSEAAATVYNIYSPPAAIPFLRFGFDGWYYTNSSAWVNVNSGVRNHVKWLVSANRSGSSTVGELQYVRLNLKIYNKTSVPYLMVYTQSGSWRKYIVSGGGGSSLTNGTKYSFYMNFNSYSREPAMISYNNAALVISVGSGAFASNEVITNIALETDSGATAGSVEFTLASVIVGEIASGVPSEKEYGFLAQVPSAYP